ncbi:MAG: hypothetical protein JRN66_07655, partial [Nitrososphaerota archaeon]|nr:hypothetical protein [Nitrososphaerota archaeon]
MPSKTILISYYLTHTAYYDMGALNSKAKENDAMSEVYFGVDVHEKESQVAVLDKEGTALLEKRFPTGKLSEFISKFPAEEKYVA